MEATSKRLPEESIDELRVSRGNWKVAFWFLFLFTALLAFGAIVGW